MWLHAHICHVFKFSLSHIFLFKVHLATTSDMYGTCLSLPGMKIDSCGKSVKLYHIANRECHFWKQEHTVFGCWPYCHWCDTTCHWNAMSAMDIYIFSLLEPDYFVCLYRSFCPSVSFSLIQLLLPLAAECLRNHRQPNVTAVHANTKTGKTGNPYSVRLDWSLYCCWGSPVYTNKSEAQLVCFLMDVIPLVTNLAVTTTLTSMLQGHIGPLNFS